MEEKKLEIRTYLKNVVTPFLTPLMESIVRERPTDLAEFSHAYMSKMIRKSMHYEEKKRDIDTSSDSDQSENE